MKRLFFEIGLNDKFSANMRKIAGKADNSIDKINRSLLKTKPLSKNLDQLEHKLRSLEKKRRLSFDIKDIKRTSREIDGIERQMARIERKGGITKGGNGSRMSGKGGKSGGMGMLASAGPIGAAAAVAYAGIRLGTEIIQTTSSYEKYRAVLKNTYQDQTKANMAMADLEKFASKTPFQINELTDSFIKLENSGFKPTMANMTSLGDLASSQGKSFGQLGEAVLDAQMGEFERLKEFGIKGATGKNSYKFTFKGETKEIEKSSKAVKEYLLSLGKLTGVKGGMNAISKTMGGKISNLADNWDQLKNAVGSANSGVIKDAIGGFSSLVGKAKDYMAVPLSQKMREEKSATTSLVNVITDHNTSAEDRNRLIEQLQEEYPDFLGNLDAETTSNEDLLKRLDAVNLSYEKRIGLQRTIEDVDFNKKKLEEAEQDKSKASLQLEALQRFKKGAITYETLKSGMTFIERGIGVQNSVVKSTGRIGKDLKDYQLRGINAYEKKLKKIITNANPEIKERKKEVALLEADKVVGDFTSFIDKDRNLDKLSGKDKERYGSLMNTLETYTGTLDRLAIPEEGTGVEIGNADFQERLKAANRVKSLITGLFEEEDISKPKQRTFGKSSSKQGLNSGVDDIAGDSRIAKNLTINIDNMIEGGINIVSQTLKEGTAEMKQKVLEALLSAVNDVNGA